MLRVASLIAACAMIAVPASAIAQAPATTPTAAPEPGTKAPTQSKTKVGKRVKRAGTPTEGANGFLPGLFAPLAALAAVGGTAAAASGGNSVSPQ